ncbi:WD repeat and HMG-box DNA-binding protein 1 [Phalaenopsis equestris]|uniref:WD repeat and HMG-box DNA-binding protein 1 n=1 Tax=Phalaenopsis equestris TaxID=78828 RepID=UPI0009E4761E|nr:WD repeat and HMG-box DNA-binding protein 1 [Phalaenopsis equestris]
MKGRTVKLKEAHRVNGTASFCSILWDHNGSFIVTACAGDPTVFIHEGGHSAKPAKALRHHREGVTAVALNPTSDTLASGSIDHSVKLYSFPDGEFQSNVTRFTLPIRALAFNKSGSLLAAAGDDDGIKMIATIDSSISRVLKGHNGSVIGLSFDPKNEFLASIDGFGTVRYWELSSGKTVHTLKSVAPSCDSDASLLNVLSWSPDGETLAVPGLKNDIVIYDRVTAEKLFTLKGDHEKPVCFLSWSPNGKYIATSGLDKQVLIWDVDQRQDIDRQKFDESISCFSWNPNSNALAVIDVMGKFGVWENPVPSFMRSPTDGAINLQSRNGNGLLLFEVNDEKPSHSGSLDEIMEESHGESIPVSSKRSRKHSVLDKSDEDSDEFHEQIVSRKRSAKRKELLRFGGGTEECESSIRAVRPKLQEAFQPGSTPVQAGKRRFLSYNLLGSITTIENEGYSHIEVDFHDTGRGPRVPSMTDYFGFTMAALNENGSVFANPCKGTKNMSTLMYRPFGSWANNSEWSMRFEGEEVKAVALGIGWVAAITSLNFLRIFTDGGLQRHILCLDGPVVTAAGFRNKLAVVTHASDCFPSGDQVLVVQAFNINNKTQLIRCRVPLSPGSGLLWFGFSEEGHLCSYDTQGVLRILSNQYGNSWLPIFSASKSKKSEDENYWVVGLDASKLFCVSCKSPNSYPLVMPKPVLVLLDLKFPLACSDLGAEDLESEFIMRNLLLHQIQEKIDENVAAGLDTSALDDDAFDMESAIDRCVLRLISSCCNADKLVRATELARLLSMEKSIKGAIKLVTTLKLPILAERFNNILEERLINESNGVSSNATVMEVKKAVISPILPSSHMFAISKASIEGKNVENEETNGGKELGGNDNEGKEKSKAQTRPFSKLSNNHDRSEEKATKPTEKELRKRTSKEEEKHLPIRGTGNSSSVEVANEKHSQRPTNPFAKSSNKMEKSLSLLDSIKKMKKVDK